MPYAIKCWVPIPTEECEDLKIYKTIHDIQSEYEDCRDMQPENHYKVVEVDEDGAEI